MVDIFRREIGCIGGFRQIPAPSQWRNVIGVDRGKCNVGAAVAETWTMPVEGEDNAHDDGHNMENRRSGRQ